MKKLILILVFCAAGPSMSAVDYNLKTCMFNNGLPMHPQSCEALKKREARNAEAGRKAGEKMAAQRALYDEQQAQVEVKRQEDQRAQEKRAQEWHAKNEEQNAMALKAQQEQRQWEVATAKAASDRTAKQKSLCGDDYRSPRVGMTLIRAKECVADFKLEGQINRADGVVSTYIAGQTYLHVMDGKIVSWGR